MVRPRVPKFPMQNSFASAIVAVLLLTAPAPAAEITGNSFANVLRGDGENDTIFGRDGADEIYGQAGDDRLSGNQGDDYLFGGLGDDFLFGDTGCTDLTKDNIVDCEVATGNDRLEGGPGADVLVGDAGVDLYVYRKPSDSPPGPGKRDTIRRFQTNLPYRHYVDLRAMDADATKDGRQPFVFIGKRPFSGKAGELRFANALLQGDTKGKGRATFEIYIKSYAGFSGPLTEDCLLLGE